MASEDEFDPATALGALESVQPETSGALAAIEMLPDTSDLLQLASTLFPGIPAMGGTLGTVVSVIGLPAQVLNIIEEYTEMKRRCGEHPGPAAHPEDADALIRRAGAFVASGRLDDALSVLDDISARFGADSDPDVARSVRHSPINALQVLNKLHRFEETLTRYDRIAEIYGTDPASAVAVDMLSARMNRLEAPGSLQRAGEALSCFDQIVMACDGLGGDDTEGLAARVQQIRVAARSMKSMILLGQGKPDEALAASGTTGEYSGTKEAVQAQGSAEQSLARAVVLHQSGRWQEAIDAYDQVLASYAKDRSVKSLAMAAACRKAALLIQVQRFEDTVRACHDQRPLSSPPPRARAAGCEAPPGLGHAGLSCGSMPCSRSRARSRSISSPSCWTRSARSGSPECPATHCSCRAALAASNSFSWLRRAAACSKSRASTADSFSRRT